MLLLAARQHFLEKGYALVRGAVEQKTVRELRCAALEAAVPRKGQLCGIPSIDTIFRHGQSKRCDPSLTAMAAHVEKRRTILHYYRMRRKQRRQQKRLLASLLNGRKMEELTGEDLWKLSTMMEKACRESGVREGKCTIRDDPQMLHAISEYRSNLWMTNQRLAHLLREAGFTSALGDLAEVVGGVSRPVVFCDSPIYREAFGSGAGFQCTAPLIGTRTTSRPAAAVTLIIFTYAPSDLRLDPHILVDSHNVVRSSVARGGRRMLQKLFSPFTLCEAHLPYQIQHLGLPPGMRATHLASGVTAFGASSSCGKPTQSNVDSIQAGDVLVVNPHLLLGFSPNATNEPEIVYRLNVVSADARPWLGSPSWIRGWRSLPQEVHFSSGTVFPPMFSDKYPR